MKQFKKVISAVIILILFTLTTFAKVQPKVEWWLEEPFRLIQTNLREIDAF